MSYYDDVWWYGNQYVTNMPKFCVKAPCCKTPEKAKLFKNNKGFMECPLCGCSYGKNDS